MRDPISYLYLGDFQQMFPKANIVLHEAYSLEAWAGCGPGGAKYTVHIYPQQTLYHHPELKGQLVPLSDDPHECDGTCC